MQHNLDFPTPEAAETRVREPQRTPQPRLHATRTSTSLAPVFLPPLDIKAKENRLEWSIAAII